MRGLGIMASLFVFGSLLAASTTVETVNAQSSPIATLSVSITGSAYSPPDIIVVKGSKVTWTNKDSTVHTVTGSGGGRETIDDPYLPAGAPAGATGDHTFNILGVVSYTCRVHPSMKGTVTVVEKFDPVQVPLVPVGADDTDLFNPKQVAINISQGVTWKNTGTKLHDVTFEDETIGALGDLKPGASISFNFTKEGTYVYRCKYHAADFSRGMIGHVGVGKNATFPVIITVNSPTPGSNVSGSVVIEGTTEAGFGRPEPDLVQVEFDRDGQWFNATGTDLWSYSWDTTAYSNAVHTIIVRALANGTELAQASLSVVVANDGSAQPGDTSSNDGSPGQAQATSEGDTPAPGVLAVFLVLGLAAWRRRR